MSKASKSKERDLQWWHITRKMKLGNRFPIKKQRVLLFSAAAIILKSILLIKPSLRSSLNTLYSLRLMKLCASKSQLTKSNMGRSNIIHTFLLLYLSLLLGLPCFNQFTLFSWYLQTQYSKLNSLGCNFFPTLSALQF